jgi:5'-nucleotidase
MLRVLISNDDGYLAPGILELKKKLDTLYDVTMIAPSEERSTTGHSLSLDKPLRLESHGANTYACTGFPGDCVLMGLGYVMKEKRPQVVVTGINRGANLGQDLYYSGTIAAAREAAFHSVPSIATSLVLTSGFKETHYATAAQIVMYMLELKFHEIVPGLTLLNLNVPNSSIGEVKGMKLTKVGYRNYSEEIHDRVDARGRQYFWIAGHLNGHHPDENTDCAAVADGYASLTFQRLVGHSPEEPSGLKQLVDKLNEKYF